MFDSIDDDKTIPEMEQTGRHKEQNDSAKARDLRLDTLALSFSFPITITFSNDRYNMTRRRDRKRNSRFVKRSKVSFLLV